MHMRLFSSSSSSSFFFFFFTSIHLITSDMDECVVALFQTTENSVEQCSSPSGVGRQSLLIIVDMLHHR